MIRNNPNQSRKFLQHYEHEKLTAEVVDNQFQCVFSMEGSNKRAKEEAIAFNFTHYLEDVEGLITTTVQILGQMKFTPVKLTLGMFFTSLLDALSHLPLDLTQILLLFLTMKRSRGNFQQTPVPVPLTFQFVIWLPVMSLSRVSSQNASSFRLGLVKYKSSSR